LETANGARTLSHHHLPRIQRHDQGFVREGIMSTIASAAPTASSAPSTIHPAHERVRGARMAPLARYRVYVQHRITEEVVQRMRSVEDLGVLDEIDSDTGEPLRARVRRLTWRLAGTTVRKRISLAALFWFSVVGLALYYVLFIPYWVRRVVAHGSGEEQSYALVLAVLLGGAGTLVLLARRFLRRWVWSAGGRGRRMTMYVAGFFYAGWFFAATSVDLAHVTVHALASLGWMLAYGLGFMVLGALAIWWGMSFTEQWWDRHACMRHPDAVVVDELARIVETMGRHPGEWLNLHGRARVLQSLERVAQCVERYLPLHLRGRDALTDRWLAEQTAGRAAAVRDLKRWVCLPKADTRQCFVDRITHDLTRAVRGDWDGLEWMDPPPQPPRGVRATVKGVIVLGVTGLGAASATLLEARVGQAISGTWDVLRPLAPVLAPVLAPIIIYLVMRVLRPALYTELPVLRRVRELLPEKPDAAP
jgi:hypothetical protein